MKDWWMAHVLGGVIVAFSVGMYTYYLVDRTLRRR